MKKQGRKPPRRKQPITQDLHPDVIELAMLLDEHRLASNANGWFTIPWRDGYNAARLALDVYDQLRKHDRVDGKPQRAHDAANLIEKGFYTKADYWLIDELLHSPMDHYGNHALRAALRCLQVKLAKSDGGGSVQNDILRTAIADDVLEDQVITWRARDALRIEDFNNRDPHQAARATRVFELAWRRGLFAAAYAIKPLA